MESNTQKETITKHKEHAANGMHEKNEGKNPAKKKRLFIVVSIAAVIVLIILMKWIGSMGHETTDNAQLDAIITPIRAIVPGFVTEVRFTDNQQVKKGDTLVLIDRKDYEARLAQAEASLESAKAQLEIAKAGVTSADLNANASAFSSMAAKENIASAKARFEKHEKDLARTEKMLKDGAATPQQFEAAKADLESAKAQYEMVKSQYEASSSQANGARSQAESQKSQIALAAATVKQREAEQALAQTQLNNTVLTAPYDGIISKKSIETGQYIQTGSPVCSAVDFKNLYVTANFKETQIENIRPGQEVEVKVDAFPHATVKGTVGSFGGATGSKFSLLPPDNATGNFVKITQRVPVRISITEYPKEMTGILLPGLSVEIDISTK